ncbi:MAG: hypothetical protein CMK59_00080 [Proteobacteria bacterium]|nr:hypothetical protein [Pseudomonadota bacterium]
MMLIIAFACSRSPIEDGWRSGGLVQVKDLFTSSFVVFEQEEIVLIDAGYDSSAKPLIETIESEGRSISEVSHIFITHGHTDHLNGLEAFPGAEVCALSQEEELIEAGGWSLDIPLSDGERVSIGDSELEVFSVPGHTSGNAVYRINNILIMGDTAQSYKDGTLSPVAEKYAEDPDQAEQSLFEFGQVMSQRSEDIEFLLFSHSGPLNGVDALLSYKPSRQ